MSLLADLNLFPKQFFKYNVPLELGSRNEPARTDRLQKSHQMQPE